MVCEPDKEGQRVHANWENSPSSSRTDQVTIIHLQQLFHVAKIYELWQGKYYVGDIIASKSRRIAKHRNLYS